MVKTWPHLPEAHSLMGKTGAHTVKLTQSRVIIESPESKVGRGASKEGEVIFSYR